MSLDPARTTVVVPDSDLETHFVARTLKHALPGLDVRVVAGRWGETPYVADDDIRAMRECVVVVKLPDPGLERRLEALGKRVIVVDNHYYAQPGRPPLDRLHGLSITEQIVALLPAMKIGRRAKCAAWMSAMERGFRPALYRAILESRSGATSDDAHKAALRTTSRVRRLALRHEAGGPVRSRSEATAIKDGLAAAGLWLADALLVGNLRRLKTRTMGSQPGAELFLVAAPVEQKPFLLDALYEREWPIGAETRLPLEALLIFCNGDKPVALEYHGPGGRRALVTELLERRCAAGGPYARLDAYAGGGDIVYFGAGDRTGHDERLISQLADELLNNLLIGARPLQAWRTHFIQALSLKEQVAMHLKRGTATRLGAAPEKDAPPAVEAADKPAAATPSDKPFPSDDQLTQVRQYFFPHVSGFLFPKPGDKGAAEEPTAGPDGDKALCSYKAALEGERRLGLRIETADEGELIRTLPVAELWVHFFFGRTVLIEWIFDGGAPIDVPRGAEYWREILNGKFEGAGTVADLLDLNAKARFAWSSYVADEPNARHRIVLRDGGGHESVLCHAGEVIENPLDDKKGYFGKLARAALCPFGIELKNCRPIWDSRSRVLTSLVPSGVAPSLPSARAAFDSMLARLHMVDGYGDGYLYDATFSKMEMNAGRYKRFDECGTFYLASSHSFVCCAFGSFPLEFIHPLHMRLHYRFMFLLVLLYGAILQNFAVEIGLESGDKARALRRSFNDFANRLWFKSVSPEVQGDELFVHMTKKSIIEREFAVVQEELKLTDELEASERIEFLSRGALLAALIAAVLAFVALAQALSEGKYPTLLRCLAKRILGADWKLEAAWTSKWFTGVILDITVVALVFFLIQGFRIWRGRRAGRRRRIGGKPGGIAGGMPDSS